MKTRTLKNSIIMPKYMNDAIITGYKCILENEIIDIQLTIYHNVHLLLKDIIKYFKQLNFTVIYWDEEEWYDFDKYKTTYITLSTNKDILNNNTNITVEIIKDLTHINVNMNL